MYIYIYISTDVFSCVLMLDMAVKRRSSSFKSMFKCCMLEGWLFCFVFFCLNWCEDYTEELLSSLGKWKSGENIFVTSMWQSNGFVILCVWGCEACLNPELGTICCHLKPQSLYTYCMCGLICLSSIKIKEYREPALSGSKTIAIDYSVWWEILKAVTSVICSPQPKG